MSALNNKYLWKLSRIMKHDFPFFVLCRYPTECYWVVEHFNAYWGQPTPRIESAIRRGMRFSSNARTTPKNITMRVVPNWTQTLQNTRQCFANQPTRRMKHVRIYIHDIKVILHLVKYWNLTFILWKLHL